MSKGYLLGDIHLGIHMMNLDKWMEIHRKYFYDFLIPILNKRYTQGDKIFILGNLFNNRSHLHHKIISFVLDLFNYFETMNYEVVIIGGDHDYLNNWDSKYSALRILEKYTNVEIFDKPNIYIFNNKKILLLPWDKHENQLKEIKKWSGKVDYLFTHSELKGAKTSNKTYSTHGNNIADFIGFSKVYASHIHIYQQLDNFKFLGCSFHMNETDEGNKKGLTVLDFNKDVDIFIENNITPEYKTIEIKNEIDLEKLDRLVEIDNMIDGKNNFINIVINNSVLLNSKEGRKKIEEITNKINILDIKHIDDNISNIESDYSDLEDDSLGITTENIIRNYIKKQQIESDLKEKIILILEDTIKLCKNDNI
jgi:phage anti-repressor protein